MKRQLQFLISCVLFSSYDSTAQNLVPDPGFEKMRRLPTRENNSITCTRNWMSPTFGASDYYNFESPGRHASTPHNVFGRQRPHSGNGYAGICIRSSYMEYIEAKLIDTLVAGQEYLVEFYISRANRSLTSVKEFGVLFVDKMRMGLGDQGLAVQPSVDFKAQGRYRNKRKWIHLSEVYLAEGTETALIIGYFNYDRPKGYRGFCHYYIDDVSVVPVSKESEPIAVEPEATREPPATFFPHVGEVMTLQNIFFNSGRSVLLPASYPELDKLVAYLMKDQEASIEIIGHTDNTGNEEQNLLLSEARAKAVSEYLAGHGINRQRTSHMGHGSSRPVANNTTEAGKKQNRRVEFIITRP